MTGEFRGMLIEKLEQRWSPEQISGHLRKTMNIKVSHETIYAMVRKDKKAGGTLYKNLRHGHKKWKKRYGSPKNQGRIKNRVSIHQRPSIVDERERIGDWEIDTIIGKNQKGVLVTAVERKSRFTLIGKALSKSAKHVADTLIQMLLPHKDKVLTITSDNGKEFAHHQLIAQQLDAQFFFADPYSSWQRGLNENTNGLIRQYFPKNVDLRSVTNHDLIPVYESINQRPRKSLNFVLPNNLFYNISKVALVT